MFSATELFFGGIEGIRSCFHVLRLRAHFRRYRGRRVSITFFALPNSFSTVPRTSGLVCMFYALKIFFDGTRSPGLVLFGTEGVRSSFNVLHSWSHFPLFQGRSVPFLCFTLPNSFSAVPWASGLDFKFCTP
jgi:hypothetical protein